MMVTAVRFLASPDDMMLTAHPAGNDAAELYFFDMPTAVDFMRNELARGGLVFDYERIDTTDNMVHDDAWPICRGGCDRG